MSDHLWIRFKHPLAGQAERFCMAMAAAMPMTEVLSDGEHKTTVRQIAKLACDLAMALAEEMFERDWIAFCETPESVRLENAKESKP